MAAWTCSGGSFRRQVGRVRCSALLCAARRRRVHMSAAPQQARLTSRSRCVLGKRFNPFESGRVNPFPARPRGKRRHRGGGQGGRRTRRVRSVRVQQVMAELLRRSTGAPLPATPASIRVGGAFARWCRFHLPHPTPHSHPAPFPNRNSWPVLAFQKSPACYVNIRRRTGYYPSWYCFKIAETGFPANFFRLILFVFDDAVRPSCQS